MEYLARGDFFWANPSSSHSSGRESRKFVNSSKEKIKSFFKLSPDFDLFFHSGATEGINIFVKGHAALNPKSHFFWAASDHSAVVNQANYLKHFECPLSFLPASKEGPINFSLVDARGPLFLNITWINNETGFVVPLNFLKELKNKFQDNIFIHLDCAQLPFKIEEWNHIPEEVDAATFSGHKFGAMKGCGFSLFKKKRINLIEALISGGGQENNIRSGTENLMGIASVLLALEEGVKKFNSKKYHEVISYRNKIEKILEEKLGDKIGIVRPKEDHLRASNTILVIFKEKKSDEVLIHFDLAGIDVGTGPACASLSLRPSRVLLNMGFSEREAKGAIRISFDYFLESADYLALEEALLKVILKL